jgi:hypothetical protein
MESRWSSLACFIEGIADSPGKWNIPSMTIIQRSLPCLLGLALLAGRAAAQSADSASSGLPAHIAALPPGSTVRVATGGERWSGKLAVTGDSLALITPAGRRQVHLAAIDSLWARGPNRHHGLLAGIGFGTLIFGLLQLNGDSAEDPGLNTHLGLIALGGSTAVGLLVDAASDRWVLRYPRRH